MRVFERFDVLGLPVDDVTQETAMSVIAAMLSSEKKMQVIIAMNPRKVISVRDDEWMKRFIWNADLVIPDGMGVVKAVGWFHGKKLNRVTGIDMMLKLCKYASDHNASVFIFGAKEDVNKRAAENLQRMYPALVIAGRHHGYVEESNMDQLVATINKSGADILFVALGSPRQEKFMEARRKDLNVKVCQGIGGSLDVLSGKISRAPAFFQRTGLEWLYRQMKDKTRRPNLKYVFVFFWECLLKRARLLLGYQ